jgi:hypothetical protein
VIAEPATQRKAADEGAAMNFSDAFAALTVRLPQFIYHGWNQHGPGALFGNR